MRSDLYDKAEKFVIDVFSKSGSPSNIAHLQCTAQWIKKLKPDADEALILAGLLHDIERAFYGDWKAGSQDPVLLKKHQNLCVLEAEKFLREQKADEEFIERVKDLIAHHEQGGSEEQDILCDADCLAYFEIAALKHAKTFEQRGKTKEETIQRFDYVFSRIHSSKARKIAGRWHDEALSELGD